MGSENLGKEKVNVLEHLSQLAVNTTNVSLSVGTQNCPTLHIGLYATLAMPTHQAFGPRFVDEFSVLMELRSVQQEESSLVTVLSPYSHIQLQLRLSPHTVTFVSTHHRHYEFPVGMLPDGQWHQVSVGVSSSWLALYVDCELVERVNWTYPGQDITTDGLLMLGGIIEGFETPFEGALRQMTFVMGDPDAARHQCNLHLPMCDGTAPKAPRSPRTPHTHQDAELSSGDLLDDLTNSKGSSRENSTDKGDAVMDPSLPEGKSPISQHAATLQQLGNGFVGVDEADPSIFTLHHTDTGTRGSNSPYTVTALDENITTDAEDRPQHDIIDLDSTGPSPSFRRKGSDQKSPSQSGHPDPSVLLEENLLPPAGSAVEQGRISSGSLTQKGQGNSEGVGQAGSDHTGLLTVAPSEGDVIVGSDNKIYRLLSGPPGPVGPPGEQGCAGKEGYIGFKGDMGSQGVRGQEGRRGETGLPGPPGLPTLYLWRNSQEDWTDFRAGLAFLEILDTDKCQDTGETWVTLGRRVCQVEEGPGAEMVSMAWMDSQGHRDCLGFRVLKESQGNQVLLAHL
ncbi:collagen alpha-1(XI) chain [Oncorhynchus kisutch]|uniref:collagen alpha-1(XI) chain n=1 Tax=Oncorhynchus kisutch TaxID=8019 RepID=UPI0012DCCE89|nr:collagen alpha-1(XI) chain-like [Oncorhynchus kisutch]